MKRRRSRKALALILVPSAIAAAVFAVSVQRAEMLPAPQSSSALPAVVEQPTESSRAIAPLAVVLPVASTPPLNIADVAADASRNTPARPDPIAELELPSPHTMLAAVSSEPIDAQSEWSGARSTHGRFMRGFAIAGGGSVGGGGGGSTPAAPSEEGTTEPPTPSAPNAGTDAGGSSDAPAHETSPDTPAPSTSPPAEGLPPDEPVPGDPTPGSSTQPPAEPIDSPTPQEPPVYVEPWPPIPPPDQSENGESQPVSVPEPSALGLFGIALLGMALGRRRAKQRR